MKKLYTKTQVEQLLTKLKTKIKKDSILYLDRRPANAQTLADLGITGKDKKFIIDGLTVEDYCGGPEPDDKYPEKQVVLFGKDFKGTELYIKFSYGADDLPVICLSFHKARDDMDYIFK